MAPQPDQNLRKSSHGPQTQDLTLSRRAPLSRRVFDIDNHYGFHGVIDPIAEKKIVDQDVANLTPIIINPTEVRNYERIRSELSRAFQELSLSPSRQHGEEIDC